MSLAPLLTCGVLAACSSSGGYAVDLFADPGQYQYYDCPMLAKAAKGTQERRKELARLIAKAEQGAAGAVVSTVVYRSDYREAGEQLVVIEREQRTKKCLTESSWRSNAVIR
jgi:hypothetical protein